MPKEAQGIRAGEDPAGSEAPTPRILELQRPREGVCADRALRVRFGELLSLLLCAPDPDPEDPSFARELGNLASGADFLHEVMSGGPPTDVPPGTPGDLASYVLSLSDDVLDSAHRIIGFEPDYGYGPHPDAEGERLNRMMRLTDYLDPQGYTFDSIREAILEADATEDPSTTDQGAAIGAAT